MNYNSIKKLIRSITRVPKSEERKCYITETNESIQNHHLYRVADLARMCVESGYKNIRSLYIPLIDLSKDEHFKLHVLSEHSCGDIEITPEEIDRFYDLENEMKPICGKVPEMLLDEYIDLHMDLCDTIDKNIEIHQSKSITEEMNIKQMFDNDIELSFEDVLKTYYTEEELFEFGDDVA